MSAATITAGQLCDVLTGLESDTPIYVEVQGARQPLVQALRIADADRDGRYDYYLEAVMPDPVDDSLIEVGRLAIDPLSRAVAVDGRLVELTGTEYALLKVLAAEPRRVFMKEELLREVWGLRILDTTTRTLDSHACRLRAKLGSGFIVNVWGVGYGLTRGAPEVAS